MRCLAGIFLAAWAATACTPESADPGLCRPSDLSAATLSIGGEDYTPHVASASAIADATSQPALQLTLDAAGASRFAALTAERVGEPLDLAIDGNVVMSPIVREPITGGELQITGNLLAAETRDLALRLSPPCVEE